MKKIILKCLALLMLVLLVGCGPSEAKYIGQRSVQYDEAKKGWNVFWAFAISENSSSFTKQEADINIEIVNDEGESVYKETKHVSEENYGEWKNNFTGNSQTLGSIFIPVGEVSKGKSQYGTLSLSATLPSGAQFDPEQIYVMNLPLMDLSISMPSLPMTINNYDYYGNVEKVGELTKLEFKYEYSATGEATLKLLTSPEGDSYFYVPYKVKDSDGIIVDSGEMFFGPLSEGDVIKTNIYLNNVELGENYTIELSDYSW